MKHDSVIISVNPKAGRTSPMLRAERLKSALETLGYHVDLMTDLDAVASQAIALHQQERLRVLVGVGGDGTAAELVNRTPIGTPVTLFPAGTANLLAKQFNLPSSPKKMAMVIDRGKTVPLDAGVANGRLFLTMFSAGIDADVVRQVHRHRNESYEKHTKKGAHISYFSYIKPIFSSIMSYQYPVIRMKKQNLASEGIAEETLSGRWAFVFNLPRYAWGVTLTPGSLGNDQQLDYGLFTSGGSISSAITVAMAQTWLHCLIPGGQFGKGQSFEFTADEQVPYQLDGDFAGFLPAKVSVVPGRFTFLVPMGKNSGK